MWTGVSSNGICMQGWVDDGRCLQGWAGADRLGQAWVSSTGCRQLQAGAGRQAEGFFYQNGMSLQETNASIL